MNRDTPPYREPLTPVQTIEAIKDVYGEIDVLRNSLLSVIRIAQAASDWRTVTRGALESAIYVSQRISNDLVSLRTELDRK